MSWLKFDTATPEKPEVFAITIALGWEDPDTTVGKLLKVWRWFDLHSVDGNASGVTLALLDRLIGVTGLSQAMVDVGWLEVSDTGLTLPNFENHNGKTAKDRALTAKRAAGHRENNKSNDKSNAPSVTNALPREEKRREEKKEEIDRESVSKAPRAVKKCPADFLITQEMQSWAAENAGTVDLKTETDKFMDYTFSSSRSDWLGTWRNWMRKAQEYAEKHKPDKPYETPYAKSMREKYEKMTPMIAAQNPNAPKKLNPNDFINAVGDYQNAKPKLRIAG